MALWGLLPMALASWRPEERVTPGGGVRAVFFTTLFRAIGRTTHSRSCTAMEGLDEAEKRSLDRPVKLSARACPEGRSRYCAARDPGSRAVCGGFRWRCSRIAPVHGEDNENH